MSTETESDAEKLRRRNHELSILNPIAEALNREIDLTQALQTALAQAAELPGLRTGWVWLLREESADSYLVASQNLPPALAKSPHRMEGTLLPGHVPRRGPERRGERERGDVHPPEMAGRWHRRVTLSRQHPPVCAWEKTRL